MSSIKAYQKPSIALILGFSLIGCGGAGSENTNTKDLPIAVNDNATVSENSSATNILVLSNDTPDSRLDSSSVQILTPPQHGVASVTNNGEVEFTPSPNYSGTDSFIYTVKDIDGNFSNPATVNITITRLPDITPPIISITDNATAVSIAKPGPYIDAGATATDDRDGIVTVTTKSTVDVNTVGNYTVTYTASDSENNTTQAVRNVSITPQLLTIKNTPHIHPNCLGTIDRSGRDLNDNDVLDDNEVTELTNPIYDKGDPVTLAKLKSMIASNEDVTTLNTCEIEDMSSLFRNNINFIQDISQWNVGSVTNMHNTFSSAKAFNGDISGWDVSKVKDMSWMFNEANSFNQNIGLWEVGNVTTMRGMFNVATIFDQDISEWDVSKVTDTYWMFRFASAFDQDINEWDVSQVTDMSLMFARAKSFNQNISSWSVEKVTNMTTMFEGSGFITSIAKWKVNNVSDMTKMFNDVTLPPAIYDSILIGWDEASKLDRDNGTPWINRTFDGGLSKPGTSGFGEKARERLISRETWSITDGL